ncbi:aminoglycoside nucleotidyltransferase ANT9 [Paractinoplanes deccanensis]|uniref:Aminoglycoside nucleotidyltransferase ANT9 n=1 Tax=Paractinoplanes deccanensis TaxID=113561 RepID=A0ABQ3Y824_9ACTN|nr:aminoglycoside adenylyltransferase domain-containing protein [Actinoplanes deccanensis]GID76144.1 aminoglycoside nucleotidyltransferase ANT9 [Actinoplanes deccanensis]
MIATAEEIARAVADVLGPAARSVILHGSLAAGGFRPGRSDIDLLAVSERRLTDAELDELERLIRDTDLRGEASGVDLDVVTAETAAAPSAQPPLELHAGRSGGLFEVERRAAAAPDLLAELSMARAGGRALHGAPPAEVIGPVPDRWVVDRGRQWLRTWLTLTDDDAHAAFMVLTACRIWRFAVEGDHLSKAEAGAWALRRRPSLIAIGAALRRLDQGERGPVAPIAPARVAAVLETVLRETE